MAIDVVTLCLLWTATIASFLISLADERADVAKITGAPECPKAAPQP